MLPVIVDFGIPLCVLLLMFIAGTDIELIDVKHLARFPRATLTGSVGQLLVTPAIGLAVIHAAAPAKSIAAGVMLLSVCPGGGISTYYTYIARANVPLSALITGLSTLLSVATIPLWLTLLSLHVEAVPGIARVPAGLILGQLLLFMVLPIAAGVLVRHRYREWMTFQAKRLRQTSFGVVVMVLLLTSISTGSVLHSLAADIAVTATAFVLLAMFIARIMSLGLFRTERDVVVIESAVRNVGIALILGRSVFSPEDLTIFASFLTGYFLIELVIVMAYASTVSKDLA